jgi:hypothetical protein
VGQSPKTFLFAKTFRAHGTNFFRQEKSFLVLAVRRATRRGRIAPPGERLNYFSVTAVYMNSVEPYRGQYHQHPYGELNEVQVAEKRGLDGAETIAFVRTELATARQTFAPLQEEPLASTPAQLADLGTYPLHAIVDMFTFDITTHVRYDIVRPRGPIEAGLRPLDERRLGPAVSWLLAGIPRMQRKLPREFDGPLGLDLTGPAGSRVTISSDGSAITVTPGTDAVSGPRATITSPTDAFLAWSTTRLPWQQLVSIEGDRDEAARFLNALNLVLRAKYSAIATPITEPAGIAWVVLRSPVSPGPQSGIRR